MNLGQEQLISGGRGFNATASTCMGANYQFVVPCCTHGGPQPFVGAIPTPCTSFNQEYLMNWNDIDDYTIGWNGRGPVDNDFADAYVEWAITKDGQELTVWELEALTDSVDFHEKAMEWYQ